MMYGWLTYNDRHAQIVWMGKTSLMCAVRLLVSGDHAVQAASGGIMVLGARCTI